MAAEHESDERTAEEISQLLYHLQVLHDRARADARRRVRPPLSTAPPQPPPPHTRSLPPRSRSVLRIAVPNKGSLSEPAVEMLKEAGLRQRRDSRELVAARPGQRRRVLLPAPARHRRVRGRGDPRRRHHRPRPAARLGVRRRGAPAARLRPLHLPVRRVPRGVDATSSDVGGRRVATSYAGLVRVAPALARHRGRRSCASTAPSSRAIKLGVADVIADVVETGTTLRGAGLEIFADPILRSEAVLVRRRAERRARRPRRADAADPGRADRARVRADGLRRAARAWSTQAVAITPGLESPTVSPLHDSDWAAVRAMVPRDQTNRVMDSLYDTRCARDPRDVDPRLPALSRSPWTGPHGTVPAALRPRRTRSPSPSSSRVTVLAVALAVSVPTDFRGDRLGFAARRRRSSSGSSGGRPPSGAVPTTTGCTCATCSFTRRLEWAQIVSVRFGSTGRGSSSTSTTATRSPSWASSAPTGSAPTPRRAGWPPWSSGSRRGARTASATPADQRSHRPCGCATATTSSPPSGSPTETRKSAGVGTRRRGEVGEHPLPLRAEPPGARLAAGPAHGVADRPAGRRPAPPCGSRPW